MKQYWNSRDKGQLLPHQMEYDHLQNTINYINKRIKEWEDVKTQFPDKDIGELRMSGRLTRSWLKNMVKELTKRRKQIKKELESF